MKISAIYEEIIVILITTVIGALITFGLDILTTNRQLSIMGSGMIVLLLLLVYVYYYYRRQKGILGIGEIFKTFDKAPKTLKLIENAKRSVDFLGISARTFFESEEVEDLMRKKIKEGCTFRFLMLDPKSTYLGLKAKDEGDDQKAWQHDIRASMLRLERLGKESDPEKVRVKLYDVLPIWRLLFIDDTLVHVTYYPHGHRGKYSPVFCLDGKKISLYDPFKSHFEYLWGVNFGTQEEM